MTITEILGYITGSTPAAARREFEEARSKLMNTIELQQQNVKANAALRNIGKLLRNGSAGGDDDVAYAKRQQ